VSLSDEPSPFPPLLFALNIALLASSCGGGSRSGSHEIKYQGSTFRLTKSYASFEDYKDDPNTSIRAKFRESSA